MVKKGFNYGYGILNPIQEPDVFTDYEIDATSGIDTIKNLTEDRYTVDTFQSLGQFKAICLRVDGVLGEIADSWVPDFLEEEKLKLIGVKARIPEIHSFLPDPLSVSPQSGKVIIDQKIVDMHPTFIAVGSEISIPAPGDIVNVDFGNRINMTDPKYYGIVFDQPLELDTSVTARGTTSNSGGSLQPNTEQRAKRAKELEKLDARIAAAASEGTCEETDGFGPTCAWSGGTMIGEIDLQSIGGNNSFDGGPNKMRGDAAKAFKEMQAAAKAVGLRIHPNSGFRSMKHQTKLYKKYLRRGSPKTAKPGTSNHQNGIAVDIAGTNSGGATKSTGAGAKYKWLCDNAYKYGFIRTVKSESWHWVYIGKASASTKRFSNWKIYGPLGMS